MKIIARPLVVCLLGAVSLLPTGAAAQSVPAQSLGPQHDAPPPSSVRRPYRGIFAPPPDPTKQSLDLTFSVFGAYDDDVYVGDAATAIGSRYRQSGWYTGGVAGLAYSRPGERVSFGAVADVGANRYINRDETITAYRTSANLGLALARRTRLSLGQSFVYAPDYRLGLFLSPDSLNGTLDPFGTVLPDLDLYRLQAYRSGTEVTLSQGLGRRSSVGAWYSLALVNYTEDFFDYRSQSAGTRFSNQVSRNARLHLGYSYNVARYLNTTGLRPQRLHNIDAGVDYGRALSFSRRTTVNFSTGSAVLVHDDLAREIENRDLSFFFIGSANLTHEIARTWTAQLGYRRGVDFREGFNDPFVSNAVNASVSGLLSRRVRFGSSVDFAIGKVGIDSRNGYNSLSANGGLEFALSRFLALYARYVYYRYEFDSNVALDPRFLRALDRQGVRIGLSASLPLVR